MPSGVDILAETFIFCITVQNSMAYVEVFWGFYELSLWHVVLDESGTVQYAASGTVQYSTARYSILKILENKCK